jgi:DNA polymerase-3 subunit delta
MLYFYYGENIYKLEEKLALFRSRYFEKFPSGINFWRLYMDDMADALQGVLETHSMFEEKKLLFIERLFSLSKSEQERWGEILRLHAEKSDQVVVVVIERLSLAELQKKGKDLSSMLRAHAKCEEFAEPTGPSLRQWVRAYLISRNGSIEPEALEGLIVRAGKSSLALSAELEKLLLFAEGRSIRKDDVILLTHADVEVNVFRTVDALASRNVSRALEELKEHWRAASDPFGILGMFVFEFRVLLLLKDAERTNGAGAHIAKRFGIHPFVLQKNLRFVKNFSREELLGIYKRLARVDRDVKSGRKEPEEALEEFVLSFATTT